MENKSLADHIGSDSLDPKRRLTILKQTAWAVEYLHTKGYIHRDLKPENILLNEEWTVQLAGM